MTMVTVTATIKGKGKLLDIYCDGIYRGRLHSADAAFAGIREGAEVDLAELEALIHEGECRRAFEAALMYLTAVPRTVEETEKKLVTKGFSPSAVAHAIAKAEEYGYIDETAAARAYIDTKCRRTGDVKLRHELNARGISREIIDEVMTEEERISEDDRAYEIAVKSYRVQATREDMQKERQRLYRKLYGRGFSQQSIMHAISRITNNSEDGDDDV